jgi:hypothetical protein
MMISLISRGDPGHMSRMMKKNRKEMKKTMNEKEMICNCGNQTFYVIKESYPPVLPTGLDIQQKYDIVCTKCHEILMVVVKAKAV